MFRKKLLPVFLSVSLLAAPAVNGKSFGQSVAGYGAWIPRVFGISALIGGVSAIPASFAAKEYQYVRFAVESALCGAVALAIADELTNYSENCNSKEVENNKGNLVSEENGIASTFVMISLSTYLVERAIECLKKTA